MGLYDQYFSGKDVSRAETDVMRAIRESRLSQAQLHELLDELEAHGHLRPKRFEKKDQSQWDEAYVQTLAMGHITDYFSREYLLYFDQVSRYVNGRKNSANRTSSLLLLLAGAAVVVVVLVAVMTRRNR